MSETSETTKPAANEFGRCGSEVRDVMAAAMQNHCLDLDVMNWQHSILADAIDRIAADVAAVKEATLPQTTEERDCAIRERDEARAEAERLLGELAEAKAEAQRIQDEADDREETERVKRLNAEIEKTHRTLLNRTWERNIAKAEAERLRADLAARPAAAGWLTDEERELLAVLRDMADCYSGVHRVWMCNWPYARVSSVAKALLARAGSPPVVEVPVMKLEVGDANTHMGQYMRGRRDAAVYYRAVLDKAGIPWKEAPRE